MYNYPNYGGVRLTTCTVCKYAPIMYADTKTCHKCGLCQWCGQNPATDLESRRCKLCRCQDCGNITKDLANYSPAQNPKDKVMWPGGNLCRPCVFKRWPEKICNKCKLREVKIGWRANLKRATICDVCAYPYNSTKGAKPLPCTWCNNPAKWTRVDASKNIPFLSCAEHQRNLCCFRTNCTPQNQCRTCLAQARASDEQRHELQDATLFLKQSDPPIFYGADAPKFRRKNRSSRFIAAELEIAGVGDPNVRVVGQELHKTAHDCPCLGCIQRRKMEIQMVASKWGMGIMRDGSLPPTGFEIVTSPAAGDKWLDQIQDICEVLRRCVACKTAGKTSCSKAAYVTSACGLHIHVDARDFAYADIRKLIRLYAPLEGVLLRTQSAERILVGHQGHTFARPCAKKYLASIENIKIDEDPKLWYKAAKKALNLGIYGENYEEKAPKSDRYHDARYNFMNLHSWYIRGTVECRGHSGTIRANPIQTWGIIWANILDSAYSMTEKDILGLNNSGKTPQDTLIEVATRNSTSKGKQAIERYLRLRWREFESGYERTEY